MKKQFGVFLVALLATGTGAQAATQFLGGTSLFHTTTSTTLAPGLMSIQWHTRAWAKNVDGGNLSNVSQALAVNFGFSRHMEIELVPMLYQDLNLSGTGTVTYNAPDDVYLRLKFGGYRLNLFDTPFNWGLTLAMRANSSKVDNVYLEPYNGGGNELGLGWGLSWHQNQLYPLEGPSAHLNINYLNHNDGGSEDALDIFTNVSNDLEFAFAYRYPTLRWEFFGELYGNFFLTKPEEYAYTRANAIWLQPGLTYRIFNGMSLSMALDLRVMESGPDLYYRDAGPPPVGVKRAQTRPTEDYPDYYPAWRVAGKFSFSPSTAFRRVDTFAEVKPQSRRDWEMREKVGVSEREIVDWLGAEDEGAEFLDLELEKIRAERRQAEKELERLREKIRREGEK
jgi:hypothetical protein